MARGPARTGIGVVLLDRQPGDPALPDELRDAVREWGTFAASVARSGRAEEVELVRRRGRQLASRVADVLGRPVAFADPVTGHVEPVDGGTTAPVPATSGPTPWSTGVPVAVFFAVLTALADIVLSRAFAGAFGLLWLPANLLVGLGLAPSVYLLRHTPFWRWPVLGAAAGLGVAWLVLLLDLLA